MSQLPKVELRYHKSTERVDADYWTRVGEMICSAARDHIVNNVISYCVVEHRADKSVARSAGCTKDDAETRARLLRAISTICDVEERYSVEFLDSMTEPLPATITL
jgi:hypothetical protein